MLRGLRSPGETMGTAMTVELLLQSLLGDPNVAMRRVEVDVTGGCELVTGKKRKCPRCRSLGLPQTQRSQQVVGVVTRESVKYDQGCAVQQMGKRTRMWWLACSSRHEHT